MVVDNLVEHRLADIGGLQRIILDASDYEWCNTAGARLDVVRHVNFTVNKHLKHYVLKTLQG